LLVNLTYALNKPVNDDVTSIVAIWLLWQYDNCHIRLWHVKA